MKEELDPSMLRLLGEYLSPDDRGRGPRDEVREVNQKLDALGRAFQQHLLEDQEKHAAHDKRIAIIEAARDAEEVTGVQSVADLRRQFRDQRARIVEMETRQKQKARAVRGFFAKVAVAATIAGLSWVLRGLSFSSPDRPAQTQTGEARR